jgi:hypothetical protein
MMHSGCMHSLVDPDLRCIVCIRVFFENRLQVLGDF